MTGNGPGMGQRDVNIGRKI